MKEVWKVGNFLLSASERKDKQRRMNFILFTKATYN